MTSIILASASVARARILSSAQVPFEIASAGVDEAAIKAQLIPRGHTPAMIASGLADTKALAVSRLRPGLVIGADQTLEFNGRCHDKTTSASETRTRLIALRGHAHHLHAAASVARDGEILWRHLSSATLSMRLFSDAFLDDYLARFGDQVRSSVGAYHYESMGAQLFDAVDGDYFAILGLPLLPLLACLRDQGALPQ